jgi:hypothetical protein
MATRSTVSGVIASRLRATGFRLRAMQSSRVDKCCGRNRLGRNMFG